MKALQSVSSINLGWKHNHVKDIAVIRKRSRGDFVISIIIAFLIIFLVSQVLVHIDNTLRVSAEDKVNSFSLVSPFEVNLAQAAEDDFSDAVKMIHSHNKVVVNEGEVFVYTVGFKNLSQKTWHQSGDNSVVLMPVPKVKASISAASRNSFFDLGQMLTAYNHPGWVGYFLLSFEAPQEPGLHYEEFVLVENGDQILPGSQFKLVIEVLDVPDDESEPEVIEEDEEKDFCKELGSENGNQLCYGTGNSNIKVDTPAATPPVNTSYNILQDDDYLIRRRRPNNPVLNSKPFIKSFTISDSTITAEDIGKQITVQATYNKPMDLSVNPGAIGIFNNLTNSNDLLYIFDCKWADVRWVTAQTIRGICTVVDNPNVILNPEQIVSTIYGARDTSGNLQTPYQFIGSDHGFSINTVTDKRPYIKEVLLSRDNITASDIGKKFTVKLKYNKKMDTSLYPSCYGVACDLINSNSDNYLLEVINDKTGWTNNKTFRVKFEIVNNPNIELSAEELSTVIYGAKDKKGREQAAYYYGGTEHGFYINTTVN